MEVSTRTRHLRHLLRVALGQEEIGQRIKQAREEAGLTQPQLAERLDLRHPQSISKYERGLTEVSTRRLERIAEVTGKPLTFFIHVPDGDQPPSQPATVDEIRQLRADVAELREQVDRVLGLLLATDESQAESKSL